MSSFKNPRDAALAVLNSATQQSRQAGSFLGQLVFDQSPMTEKQAAWLAKILDRAGLPGLEADR